MFHLSFILCLWVHFRCPKCLLAFLWPLENLSLNLSWSFNVSLVQHGKRLQVEKAYGFVLGSLPSPSLPSAAAAFAVLFITVDFFDFGLPYQATLVEFQQLIRILLFGLFGCNHDRFRLTFQQHAKLELTIRFTASRSCTQEFFHLVVQCHLLH